MTNRVALLTGATGGVGRVVAEMFAAHGYRLALVARHADAVEALADSLAVPTLALTADVTLPEAAAEVVQATKADFGRLDVVVHLAGGYAGGKALPEIELETWERMLRLNLTSAFLIARAALPLMHEHDFGRLLFVSSLHGHAPGKHVAAYAAAKGGLETLVRAIAADTRGTGITANAVAPGIIDTPANRRAMPNADTSTWVAPERLAATLLFLASEAAADINGAILPLPGRG